MAAKEKAKKIQEELADDEQEKNRWKFKTFHDKNGEAFFLHSSQRPDNCKGELRAIKVRMQMEQNEVIKELCWYKGNGATEVTLVDPEAILFGKTKIDAALFLSIPSDRERKAEERRIREERIAQEIYRDLQRQQRSTGPQRELRRDPITCIDLGVGMTSCM